MKLKLTVIAGLFLLSPILFSPVYADVVINEIFPKPSDPANQWIELYNTGVDTVSLNLWKLEEAIGGTSYIIPASGSIGPKGFYTVSKSQSAIDLKAEGDTVRLFNGNNSLVDSQSYQSTLGVSNSVGRSPDGGPGMTVCTTNTYNLPNDCPTPTPMPSPTPAPPATSTPIPTATVAPTFTPAPTEALFNSIPIVNVLGASTKPANPGTPTPTPDENVIQIPVPKTVVVSKTLVWQIIAVALSWMILAILAAINGRRNRRKKKPVNPGQDSGPTL